MYACSPVNQWYSGLCEKQHSQQSEGSDCVCCTLVKTPPGLLYPGLRPPAQEGCGAVRWGPRGGPQR